MTKDSDARVKHVSDGVKKHYENNCGSFKGKHHTQDTRLKLSENAKNNNWQSHWCMRKAYEYNGIIFQSNYEVLVAKSLDENNIKWSKPDYGVFTYKDLTDKTHTYTPDFYLQDYNVYLDPKNDFLINNNNPTLGYCDSDKIRWVEEQNNVKIIILNKNQLTWDIIKTLL